MRPLIRAALLALLPLLGCAGERPPPPPTVVVLPPGAAPAVIPPPSTPEARAGGWAVGVVGTPIFLALKGAACVASLAIAAPLAAAAELGAGAYRDDTLRTLGEGVGRNCGPPYVLVPPRQPPVPPAG